MFQVILLAALLILAGCNSLMTKILPAQFQPVTKERCESLDLYEFGKADGKTAQRPGEKFDFWNRDCIATGVKISRENYDKGYQEGIQEYCSCEKGYMSGVKDQLVELQGQYFACMKTEFKIYKWGYDQGKKEINNLEWIDKSNPIEFKYKEDLIAASGKQICQNPPAHF